MFHHWSQINETIRYISNLKVIIRTIFFFKYECYVTSNYCQKHDYDIRIRAFEYFATSWPLYKRFQDDFNLPSISFDIKILKLDGINFLGDILVQFLKIRKSPFF